MFGSVGDGFFCLKTAEAGNGAEFIKFCERLLEIFGKVQLGWTGPATTCPKR